MFTATIDTSKITVKSDKAEMLVSGSVNVNFIEFLFSEDWADLKKTVIFQTKKVSIPIVLDTDTHFLPIPWECLAYAGETINVGAYGVRMDDLETDEDETIVLPTVWGSVGRVVAGVTVPNVPGPYPTPDAYYQLLKLLEDLIENGGVGGGGAGTFNHDLLKNRDLPDQHPIDSITDLREILESDKVSIQTLDELTKGLLDRLDALEIPSIEGLVTEEAFIASMDSVDQNLKLMDDNLTDLEIRVDELDKTLPDLITTNDLNKYDTKTKPERVRSMIRESFDGLTNEQKQGMIVVTDEEGWEKNEYSEEETVIGKWIDGRPVYRRVVYREGTHDSTNNLIAWNVNFYFTLGGYEPDLDLLINAYGSMNIITPDLQHETVYMVPTCVPIPPSRYDFIQTGGFYTQTSSAVPGKQIVFVGRVQNNSPTIKLWAVLEYIKKEG